MSFPIYNKETLTNAGATYSIPLDATFPLEAFLIRPSANPVTMLADTIVEFTGTPTDGQTITIIWEAGATINNGGGITFTINGIALTDLQALKEGQITFKYIDGAVPAWIDSYSTDLRVAGSLSGLVLQDASLTLAKFPAQTRGYIWAGDATGRPALLDAKTNLSWLIGDGTDLLSLAINGATSVVSAAISGGAIVFSYLAGSITNAAINASAAIAWSKMAALSSGNILVGSAGNVATSVTMSGDATLDNTGALTIANSAVSNAKIATDAVTLSKLASTGQLYAYSTTTATAANTTETALASFAMTSAIADADGDVLEVYAYGSFGATANNKSVRLRFGATLATATQLCINTTTAAPNGINWVVRAKIFRNGAASQKGQAEILFSGIASELDNFTATETWATSTIYLSGQNGTAAANDIVLEGFEVKIARTSNG